MCKQRVEIYYNLHKKLFSVRDMDTGRVCMHTGFALLRDVQFVVQPAGRERVLREQSKNVHAFIRGWFWNEDDVSLAPRFERIATYNPYKYDSFVDTETSKPLDKADEVLLELDWDTKKPTIFYYVK